MKNWKNICYKLLYPPLWLILILTVFSTATLIAIFISGLEEHPAAYVMYPISAYTLAALCLFFSRILPGQYQKTRQRVYSHPFGNQYLTDASFRVRVSLYVSLTINVAYSAFNLIVGVVYSSLWMGALAVYYVLLSLLRFLLLRYMRSDKEGIWHEYRRYRLCGILMLILHLSLTGIVFQVVRQNQGSNYPGVMVFAVAAYTFYSVTISIVDLIKYRKYKSPVLSASKAIRLAAALVSLLSLETAMLVQFGEDEAFRRLMTAATGAGICLIVLGISVYMIIQSSRFLSKKKNRKEE